MQANKQTTSLLSSKADTNISMMPLKSHAKEDAYNASSTGSLQDISHNSLMDNPGEQGWVMLVSHSHDTVLQQQARCGNPAYSNV